MLSNNGGALFAGEAQDFPGCMRSYTLPLQQNEFARYVSHDLPVTRISVTRDDATLVSAGEDG